MYGKSLAQQHFRRSIEAEIRNHWLIKTSVIYTKRWWEKIGEGEMPVRITEFPGDNINPFNSIDISPAEYLESISKTEKFTEENSIVNFITAFEVYLFDITKRILFLAPELVGESEMPFEAKEIAEAMNNNNLKDWFAEKVTYKYIKNKTHLKMIQKLGKVLKFDLYNPMKEIIEEWNKWTYVRNAIVHNGRQVSEDLNRVWPDKFPSASVGLNLEERDIVRVHYLAMELCKYIDKVLVDRVIGPEDSILLIRELFVRFGIDNPKELSSRVFHVLNSKMKIPMIEKCLGHQRKTGEEIKGWNFTNYNLEEKTACPEVA